jgi:glycosyltransferase involved in cell wall biosynthesis
LLKQKGVNPRLNIVGCVPPHDLSAEKNVTVIPFLDKNNIEDFQQLHKIFFQTDLLLLPTRAECAGVVFSEASAYGIPCITTETGGVRTYVQDGVNGYALPFNADANAYTEIISELYNDKTRWEKLKKSCRQYYDSRLNWNLWGKRFQEIAETLQQQKK